MKTLKIGLTGGMGCGKSAAGAIFRELGIEVLDADALARRALSENPQVRAALSEIFEGCAFLPDGSPNRPEIATTQSPAPSTTEPAQNSQYTQSAGEQQSDKSKTESSDPHSQSTAKSKRRAGRSAVPSWDEILFGD